MNNHYSHDYSAYLRRLVENVRSSNGASADNYMIRNGYTAGVNSVGITFLKEQEQVQGDRPSNLHIKHSSITHISHMFNVQYLHLLLKTQQHKNVLYTSMQNKKWAKQSLADRIFLNYVFRAISVLLLQQVVFFSFNNYIKIALLLHSRQTKCSRSTSSFRSAMPNFLVAYNSTKKNAF